MMKKLSFLLLLLGLYNAGQTQKLIGFTDADASKQTDLEKRFDASVKAEDLDMWMKFLSSHPHHVGSPQGKANAEYIASLFRQWGYQTEIKTYYVLFPTPKVRSLELLGARPYKAKLEEPALSEDHTSAQKAEQLPSYNAYSADGDVTAELVFVNRGVPADYIELEKRGVSVKGKIVIAKYGGSWRGIKPKVAYEHGAIGCIIYSDPADDGYGAGDTYPNGPYRPKNGVQRGSVMDMPVYPGDPLTPNVAATKDAKRLTKEEAVTIMKIPVLPLSYEDALPLLESLKGQPVPPSWRGGLPITYHIGPSVEKVHLKLAFNWETRPVNDVIATLPGSEYPDQWVIRGNHHDAWVNGAADPLSGMVAELEEAKAVGEMVRNGYRPKRTLIYCAWDGEEPSLLGSTEWMEDHQDALKQKAVAYINTDGNGRGFIDAEGSHTLEPFFNQVIGDVTDPETGVTVKERKYAKQLVDADATKRAEMLDDHNVKLGALGAGSDYSPFIQHLGIASINLGYGGEDEGGEYHSIYDSYDLFTRFKDPGFAYGVTLTKTAGRLMLRLADADVLPFEFNSFYRTFSTYVKEVKDLADKERRETEVENQMIRQNLFTLANDPTKKFIQPKPKEVAPYLNFSDLDNGLAALKASVDTMAALYANAVKLPKDQLDKLNENLYMAERDLTNNEGLPRRPWYRHEIYAPGFYTGYGVKTLPAIREAIEQHNWKEAQQGIFAVSKAVASYNNRVKEAIAACNRPTF